METSDQFVLAPPQTAPSEWDDRPSPNGSEKALEYGCMREPHTSVQGSPSSQDRVHDISSPDHDEDLVLIRAIAERDRRAFETLYYRYAPRLGRYLSRLLRQRETIEEVLNDVMLVLWQSAGRFNPAASRLSTWLFGIAHHKALKALARCSRQSAETPLGPIPADADPPDSDHPASKPHPDNPERTLMGRQFGRALEWALENLSTEHRAVIELAFGEDRSYQEIATITGCPVNTVKTRMFHARKRLAQLLALRGLDLDASTRGRGE